VRRIGPFRKDVSAGTLRSRYAELLRLRGYVQRLERICRDNAEDCKHGWRIAERCEHED
jgi:hypothetical protein